MTRVVAAVLTVALALPSCGSAQADAETAPLTVVLFDVSGSTGAPDIRERYLEAFGSVVTHVAGTHGTVVGDVIDENPLAHASFPIHVAFKTCDPLRENPLVCDATWEQGRAEALAGAEAILARTPEAPGTDIHGALLLAGRVFAAYPEARSRSLVVFSDMIERTDRLNVVRLAEDEQAASLEAMAADGLLADLEGVTVYVVGAGVQAGTDLPADRIRSIERFWHAYFARAGAELAEERYGPTLLRFP
jgi:hypothetical protein